MIMIISPIFFNIFKIISIFVVVVVVVVVVVITLNFKARVFKNQGVIMYRPTVVCLG